ncbi:MAG: indoleamine 2,3-dioxygenase, partial [Pseudomonadota bacterium]
PRALPASVAVPIWQLSESIGQPPLLTYSAYVLDNWGRIDPAKGIDLSNIYMNQPFLGGQDEAWFVLIHVAIEARAGAMLATIPSLIAACESDDTHTLESGLASMTVVWDDMNAIFNRMPERCDPYVYFHRVRPWIHGWKDNPALADGLIYEGVEDLDGKPQSFRGQTGSQSSIVPTMDAFLGVDHAGDPLRTYLDQLHVYRPPEHRRFIDDIRASSKLREHIQQTGNTALKSLYNDCIENLTRFRTRHLEYAASYINKQSRGGSGNTSDVGTGGTPFMKYLKKHRDEADAHLLR